MREINKNLQTHTLDYEPSESKTLPRATFRSLIPGEYPTFGITTWLMLDFSGVKSIKKTVILSREIYNAYLKATPVLTWNTQYNGPIPKSRRATQKLKKPTSDTNIDKIENKNNLVWNTTKKKILKKGKIFNCMRLSKDGVKKLAKSLNVNPDGFKQDVCDRIEKKIRIK